MSAASSPSEPHASAAHAQALSPIRVSGGLEAVFARRAERTHISRLAEADGYRLRLTAGASPCEAVIMNTGGGVAGGDRVRLAFALAEGTALTVTSVGAERIYRALHAPAELDVTLSLAPGANLAFLPQETILFDGASMRRRFTIDLAEDSELTLLDIFVLGRRGHDEVMRQGDIRDQWRVSRAGSLIHAEALRLDGDIAGAMARPAIAGAAHVAATLLHVARDAPDRLEAVRARLAAFPDIRVAASAWNGKLVVRALGHGSDGIRKALAAAAVVLTGRAMPRSWQL